MNSDKLTVGNILLGIIGILIFSSLIILPPTFRILFPKDKNVVETKPNNNDVIKKNVVCTRSSDSDTSSISIKFELYNDNNLMNLVAVTKTTSFDDSVEIATDNYEDTKNTFNIDSKFFYSYTIEESRVTENYRVTITENDNLPIVVESININSVYNDLYDELVSDGYTCN